MVKKLYKMAEHEDAKIEMDNEHGVTISVPQEWVKIRPTIKRVMTEEQKAVAAERLKNVREEKKSAPKDNAP